MNDTAWPAEFKDLQRFAPWALPTEAARMRKRLASDMTELTDFYTAMLPRMEALAEHLAQYPLESLPAPQSPCCTWASCSWRQQCAWSCSRIRMCRKASAPSTSRCCRKPWSAVC